MACTVDGCKNTTIAKGLCAKHYQRARKSGNTEAPPKWNPNLDFLYGLDLTVAECIIWPFGRGGSGQGYGVVRYNGKHTTAHRASLMIHVGEPCSPSLEAAHDPSQCTNILCVNPRHLRWATRAENESDKAILGTITKGTAASTSGLSEADVLAIAASEERPATCAARYGIHEMTVRRIRSGHCWGWLTGIRRL